MLIMAFRFKRKSKLAPYLATVLLLFATACLCILADRMLRQTFFAIAEIKAVQVATEVLQETVKREVLNENIRYQDIIFVHKDSQGRVTLMEADTAKVNRVAAETALAVQKSLEELKRQTFTIPLGQVLGIPMFANYGPKIKYTILPAGTVRVNVVDKFDSAGINQTKHSIYLYFTAHVKIVVPSKSGEAQVTAQVPLAESIIVGSVPSALVSIPGGILGYSGLEIGQ